MHLRQNSHIVQIPRAVFLKVQTLRERAVFYFKMIRLKEKHNRRVDRGDEIDGIFNIFFFRVAGDHRLDKNISVAGHFQKFFMFFPIGPALC